MRRIVSLGLAVATIIFTTACGGGGGGGGGPTAPPPPPPPTQGLTFTAAGAPTGTSLALQRINSGNDVLELALEARSLNGVYGLYFDLEFPAAILEFQNIEEGTLLGSDGSATTIQAIQQGSRLVVATTRLGQVGGASGSTGTVVVLRFRPLANGSGQLTFTNNAAEAQDSRVLNAQWLGGSVNVNL